MKEKILKNKDTIMSIALMDDRILIGVTHGMEPLIVTKLEKPLGELGINFAVGWEISVSRYPVLLVRSREWVYKEQEE